MTKIIAPSILAADFSRLGDEIRAVEEAGAGWIHLDVMDGHFVPNLTMGPALARSIRGTTKLPFDAHLMVEEPTKFVEPFVEAGANWISVHAEVCDPASLLPAIKDMGCKAGLVINPPTDVNKILPNVKYADYVLVMTVNPGFAGQKMIEESVQKIDVLKKYRDEHKLDYLIQVDGGINLDTISRVKHADIFVVGNGVFKTADYAATIKKLTDIVLK